MAGDALEKTHEPMTIRQILATLRDPRIYNNFLIHLFIMIPTAVYLSFLSLRLDRHFGWRPLAGLSFRLPVSFLLLALGGAVVVYSYAYLVARGDGSPGSHLGGPTKHVSSGPYALVRHPSVMGKLMGVVGLGVLSGSWSFLFAVIPILLVYSLLTNRFIQERYCERVFGEAYRVYRRRVPMLIPKPGDLADFFAGRLRDAPTATLPQNTGKIPRSELAIYLVLMTGLVAAITMVILFLTRG